VLEGVGGQLVSDLDHIDDAIPAQVGQLGAEPPTHGAEGVRAFAVQVQAGCGLVRYDGHRASRVL
jgi:hypothetical protein